MNLSPHPLFLDKILIQPTRLNILTHLARNGGEVAYLDVLPILGKNQFGSLSEHNRILETAGYIELRKEFVNRRPLTTVVLTPKGRAALTALSSLTGCTDTADTAA
jgi:DNA-binding MarR family transcriptional regulator